MKIPIDKILPNPDQPRKNFDQVELDYLAESINLYGLINPIAVEEAGNGLYILIDGERRWRAHQLAGLTEIEASVRPSSNGSNQHERLALAIVANLQRSNLSTSEESLAFLRMKNELNLTINQISKLSGYSPSTINNRFLFSKLEPEIQALFDKKSLPFCYETLSALMSVPHDIRNQLAFKFAQRGTSAKYIVITCKKYASSMQVSSKTIEPVKSPLIDPDDTIPAIVTVRKNTKSQPDETHYNALVQLGSLPPWQIVRDAASMECKDGCSLYDQASGVICHGCPLPGFLIRLIKSSKGQV